MRLKRSGIAEECGSHRHAPVPYHEAMPNIATALKAEIARLARKELRTQVESTKTALASYRHQIAEIKRKVRALEREVAGLRKQGLALVTAKPVDAANLRFRSAGFAQHRQRLGLSAREMGMLLGASALSVYKWESGQARPRAKHLEAIAALRKIGKRAAMERLEKLST
jgi:DNA-binding transcriptional regulator YiaG